MPLSPPPPPPTPPPVDGDSIDAANSPRRRGTFIATVKENRPLCAEHYRLVLGLEHFPPSVPGQFVEVDCSDSQMYADHGAGPREFSWPPEGAGESGRVTVTDPDFNAPLPYLRRPFSIARHRSWMDGYTEIDIVHRVAGKGTLQLAQLRAGQKISILGPLGKGFEIPASLEHACLVGGGVGIPPMFYLAEALARELVGGATAFIGAQRHDLLPVTFVTETAPSAQGEPLLNVQEFSEFAYPSVITTDDGTLGMKGYVTDALRKFLQERQARLGHLNGVIVYCCGPTPMMRATARVAASFDVMCQVSLEQPMACGMGTCQSCVIRHRPHGSPEAEWKYKLTCTDGPVFDARDIVW